MSLSKVTVHCVVHPSHLFSHPLCSHQPLWRRVAIFAFHAFTLAIPLALYQIVSYCASRITPFSPHLDAMRFARAELKKHSEIIPWSFRKTHQPVNQEIALLTSLYWNVCWQGFFQRIKQYPVDPWGQQEVIDAADACMKIAYAIGILTLEDLSSCYAKRVATNDLQLTPAQMLTTQDSYQYRTFYYLTRHYHDIRAAVIWNKPGEEEGYRPQQRIPADHAALFYKKGTTHNSWNVLYNTYCDKIREYVSDKDLKKADQRAVHWTQKDTGVSTFVTVPDTRPD
jgi:hypothetical protein